MPQSNSAFDDEEQFETNSCTRSLDPSNNMISSPLQDGVKAVDKTGGDKAKKRSKRKKRHQSYTIRDTLIYPEKSKLCHESHSTKSTRVDSLPDEYTFERSHLWPREQDEQWESRTKSSDLASMGGFTDVDVDSIWARGSGKSVNGESIDYPRKVFTTIDHQNEQHRSLDTAKEKSTILISSPSVTADLLLTNDAFPFLESKGATRMSVNADLADESEFSSAWKENDVTITRLSKKQDAFHDEFSEEGTFREIDEIRELSVMDNASRSGGGFCIPRNKFFRFSLVFGFLILVAAITGTTIALLQKRGTSTGSNTSSEFTISPSSTPAMTYDQLHNWALNVSGYSALNQPDSPQVQAVMWMAGFDRFYFDSIDLPFLQRYALAVFFFSTGGYTWTDWKSWLDPDLHECDWSEGFTCLIDELQRRVVIGINETGNGLSGSLPLELNLLDDLVHLHIANNTIDGSIPGIFGQLSKLTSLDLSSNKLHGPIPPSIMWAKDLVELRLSNNNINGSIPSTLYELSMLQTLDLSWNEIMGPIIDDVARLQKLVTLNVRHNHLSGSVPLASIDYTNLDYLWLDFNKFSGSFPRFTLAMANALEVTMSHNQLTGTFPFANTEYRLLQDGGNKFLMRQQKSDFSYNRMSGTIDIILGLLPNLRYADYSGNGFNGQFPGDVGWSSIEHLAIGNNYFTGTIPAGWGQSVTHLDFSNNSMIGGIPSGLCKFLSLKFLKLDHNLDLSGSIPWCLFNLSNLQGVNLSATNSIGTVPTSIGQLLDLGSLDISGNFFNGTLPSEIGMCTKLIALDASNNQMTGVMPSDLGRLEFLQSFLVGNNSLTGLVPRELATLANLESLSLSGNNLHGSIPQELCSRREDWKLLDVGCGVECRCCEYNTNKQC